MFRVKATKYPTTWVREDGFVSQTGNLGPWSLGLCVCINSDLVRLKGRTPKYYYIVHEGLEFVYVHRLVAIAFCENPNPYGFRLVDHISGDSLANAASNLRWLNHQLNCMNQVGTKNCYFMRKCKKWRASVTINKKRYNWGYFKTYRQAHLSAQSFKAAKFTEIYRTLIKNETPTTTTCQYIHGRPGPVVFGPPLHSPGVCGACLLRPKEQCVCSELSETSSETSSEDVATPVSLVTPVRTVYPCRPGPKTRRPGQQKE